MRNTVPPTTEQAAAQHFVDRAFPAVAAFLAEPRDARPDADLMRQDTPVDAPQVSESEVFAAYREVFAEQQTHVIRLLDSPGATLTVTCPSWCESDHAEEETHGTFAEDFAHRGAEEALHVWIDGTDGEDVLLTEITQYPFGKDMRTPTVLLWPSLGLTETQLDPDGVVELADNLRTYADALDELAKRLEGVREQTAQAHRADHEGRWTR